LTLGGGMFVFYSAMPVFVITGSPDRSDRVEQGGGPDGGSLRNRY
jgi:hypothetical protein